MTFLLHLAFELNVSECVNTIILVLPQMIEEIETVCSRLGTMNDKVSLLKLSLKICII